jgi:hypothetical protein
MDRQVIRFPESQREGLGICSVLAFDAIREGTQSPNAYLGL